MIVLDACVLIAHFSPTDAHHEAAGRVLRDAVDDEMTMHPVNLAEVLIGGVRIGQGSQMYDDVRALGVGVADAGIADALRLAELRVETGLKLPDCYALATAEVHAAAPGGALALATFDAHLADVARARGISVIG